MVLTLNTDDAVRSGIAAGTAPNLNAALLAARPCRRSGRNAVLHVRRATPRSLHATDPVVSGLLLTLGMLGLLIEMQTLHGIAGVIGVGFFRALLWDARLCGLLQRSSSSALAVLWVDWNPLGAVTRRAGPRIARDSRRRRALGRRAASPSARRSYSWASESDRDGDRWLTVIAFSIHGHARFPRTRGRIAWRSPRRKDRSRLPAPELSARCAAA